MRSFPVPMSFDHTQDFVMQDRPECVVWLSVQRVPAVLDSVKSELHNRIRLHPKKPLLVSLLPAGRYAIGGMSEGLGRSFQISHVLEETYPTSLSCERLASSENPQDRSVHILVFSCLSKPEQISSNPSSSWSRLSQTKAVLLREICDPPYMLGDLTGQVHGSIRGVLGP